MSCRFRPPTGSTISSIVGQQSTARPSSPPSWRKTICISRYVIRLFVSSNGTVQREICPLKGCSLDLREEKDKVRLAAASRGHRTAVSQTTATRALRASIRIVAGQASGEAVGSKLVDRIRVSILDCYYRTAISRVRFHSVRNPRMAGR